MRTPPRPSARGGPIDAREPDESIADWLRRVDPDLADAACEVDRTLLTESLALSPTDRLRVCTRTVRGLDRFRRATS